MSAIVAAGLGAAPTPALAAGQTAPASGSLELVLPLTADVEGLERFALAVTTPGSPQYGQYESVAALAARYGASASVRSRVVAYLRASGASNVDIDPTGLFADATMPVGLAQRLFRTPLAQFHTASDGTFVAPTRQPLVPPALAGLVDGVIGLNTRPFHPSLRPLGSGSLPANARPAAGQPPSALHHTGTARGCGKAKRTHGFTPNQYLTAYGFDRMHRSRLKGYGERVALIEIDGFRNSDIKTFARCFGIRLPPIRAWGVGIRKPLRPGGEATLDTEILSAAAPSLRSIDVYESRPLAVNVLRSFTAPLRNKGRKPNVISASLGLCELEEVGAIGRSGILHSEAAFALVAASGITYIAASGDFGSAACAGPSGLPRHELAVSYPASSWYVTGVGGTNLALTRTNRIAAEIVWNDTDLLSVPGAGGGGPSVLFRPPPYQSGLGLSTRGVPDLALLSDVAPGYAIHCSARPDCIHGSHHRAWRTVGGTSAAAPLLAGAAALIDQSLRQRGRRNVGLLNPILYRAGRSAAAARIFHDVTAYGNDIGPFIARGGGQPVGCCTAGFGYDEASGWGSIDVAQVAGYARTVVPRR